MDYLLSHPFYVELFGSWKNIKIQIVDEIFSRLESNDFRKSPNFTKEEYMEQKRKIKDLDTSFEEEELDRGR